MSNDGGPAFPTKNEYQTGPNTYHYEGMSRHDYFAAHAMQGILAGAAARVRSLSDLPSPDTVKRWAREYASAMIDTPTPTKG